ncbi:hypothetical protein Dgeo_2005 [Deinococcus geothermalis DSM 11300]|uniref:Uncharacterized protein n=2 Tax=Deinococcus geothermalis TaxID=68909 RepID=Q1IWT5_DEIGD|nr:hypothetical protein Dgeo_2005 [Deinococcus geothermalis DSM 11300]
MSERRAMKRTLTLLACLLGVGTGLAVTRVPGTSTSYSAQRDPITDANTGLISIDEVNDTYGETALTIRCSDRDRPDLWATLISTHDLFSEDQVLFGMKPAITIRWGDDPPVVLRDSDLISVVNSREDLQTRQIGVQGPVVQRIVNGLSAGKRLVARVNRVSGGQALTYTFPGVGFATAWEGVKKGASFGSPSANFTQSPVTAGGATGAPKFTQWYFTTCRDAVSGAARAGLVAGRAHLCDLVVETVPNGTQPVAAEFRYELEYRENGRAGKLTLPGAAQAPAFGRRGTG